MKMIIEWCVLSARATRVCTPLPYTKKYPCNKKFVTCSASSSSSSTITRRPLSLFLISTTFSVFIFSLPPPPSYSSSKPTIADFSELPNSGGVKALELLVGSGEVPSDGDQVAIHYYGRLAAKQGWRFDSTYDHKDENGDPNPFVFVLGSGKVIAGIEVAVRSMKVGGIRRVIIPPSLGYQNTSQEPIPPNVRNFFCSRDLHGQALTDIYLQFPTFKIQCPLAILRILAVVACLCISTIQYLSRKFFFHYTLFESSLIGVKVGIEKTSKILCPNISI